MWKKLVTWLRKMPVAKWIKPIWKGAVKDIIAKEGDKLQEEAKRLVSWRVPRGIDRSVDAWQRSLLAALAAVPLPDAARKKLSDCVQKKGDVLQARLTEAVTLGSGPLIDSLFDYVQDALLREVDAL